MDTLALPPVPDEEEFKAWKARRKPPAPPPLARPDVTRVAPRPAPTPPKPPLIQRVQGVQKAVRRAIVPKTTLPSLSGGIKALEKGAFDFGKEQGDFLLAQNPGAMPKAQDYATAEEFGRANEEYAKRYTTGMLNVMSTVEGGGVPKGGRVAKAPKPAPAAPIRRKVETVPFDAYSRLESAVEAAPFEKGTAEQWAAALSKNVAKGEREFRGVDRLLESKKGQVLERDALRQQLEENPIKIERSQYGGKARSAPEDVRWEPHQYSQDIWHTQASLNPARYDAVIERRSPLVIPGQPRGPDLYDVEVAGFPKKTFENFERAKNHAKHLVSIQKAYKDGWKIIEQGDPGTGEVFVVERPDRVGVSYESNRADAERLMAELANAARREAGVTKRPRFESYKQPSGENYTETVLTLERNPLAELPPGYEIRPGQREGFETGALTFDQAEARGWELRPADGGGWWMVKPDGNVRGLANTQNLERAREMLAREAEQMEGGRQTITNPGSDESQRFAVDPDDYYGQPYRDWLAQHEPGVDRTWHTMDPHGRPVPNAEGPDPATAKRIALKSLQPRPFQQPGHWPDENPLGHHRFTDHKRPDGTTERFVEEIQSDWMQKARKKALADKAIPKLEAEVIELSNNIGYLTPEEKVRLEQVKRDLDKANWTRRELADLPGQRPFEKTEEWTELLLKDIIDQALTDGVDRVTIATGKQNAALYSLQKQVDHITYEPETGVLVAKKNGVELHRGNYDWRALDDVIGKEAAERLLATPAVKLGTGPRAGSMHTLEGEGLKVGGTGMEGFYDEMIPKVIKEYARKRGIQLELEQSDLFSKGTEATRRVEPASPDLPAGQGRYRQDPNAEAVELTAENGELREDLFEQGANLLDDPMFLDVLNADRGHELRWEIPPSELQAYMRELHREVRPGRSFHQVLDTQPPAVRQQIMDVLGLERVRELPPRSHIVEGNIPPTPVFKRNLLQKIGEIMDEDEDNPINMQLRDILWRIEGRGTYSRQSPRDAIEESLEQLANDVDHHAAEMVADEMGLRWITAPTPQKNPSFRLEPFKGAGPQPLWAVGAGGGAALALQQQGGGDPPAVPDEEEFQAWKQKNMPPVPDEAEFEAWKAAQAPAPKKGILERVNTAARDFRRAVMPKTLEKLEKGATRAGEEYGHSAMEVANAIKVYLDPAKTNTEESKRAGQVLMLAIVSEVLPLPVVLRARAALRQAGVKLPPPAPKATPNRPVWDRNAQQIDQPQPLTREQEILRARLKTEGINPSGAMRRRPTAPPPPVEPGPDAATYTTPSSVKRRPKAEAPPAEAPPAPVERRADPEAPRVTWTPEERARYITDKQKAYAATINKPWSQWTDEEKIGYFKGQEAVKRDAPWQPRATAAPEPETWPPLPKEGDITPVAAAGVSDLEVRPGIMRKANAGEPALPSPLRLPEPTAADRAVVQPKGYKEVSPEEVAARKAAERPEPVATAAPKALREEMPEGAKVDEEGLFFEHRTPSGELRDFRRVSTDGLVKAHREMEEQIVRDQQLAVYRNVEADVSGTQYGVNINAATKTSRGTSQQAEAAERLRNYEKVMKRIDAELEKRGIGTEELVARRQAQEELEAAIEREAIDYANREMDVDTDFDFDDLDADTPAPPRSRKGTTREPPEEPVSDILNVAKLNLGSKTAEQRMAAKLEEFRALRDQNKQTWAEADINRAEILDELRAQDPKALSTDRAKKLSGEELLARRDLVRENDEIIRGLSKRMEEAATPEAHAQAAELLERAVQHNDALLSDLVSGSSQKGRDLNLLKRLANNSLDVDVWRVQAKRMLGDRPLTAEIDAMIRKLAQEAQDACG